MSSQYEAIWKQLKEKKLCRVTSVRPLHPRIVKAVTKRKDQDLAYKFELEEKHQYARMTHSSQDSVITFKLQIKDRVTNI